MPKMIVSIRLVAKVDAHFHETLQQDDFWLHNEECCQQHPLLMYVIAPLSSLTTLLITQH